MEISPIVQLSDRVQGSPVCPPRRESPTLGCAVGDRSRGGQPGRVWFQAYVLLITRETACTLCFGRAGPRVCESLCAWSDGTHPALDLLPRAAAGRSKWPRSASWYGRCGYCLAAAGSVDTGSFGRLCALGTAGAIVRRACYSFCYILPFACVLPVSASTWL